MDRLRSTARTAMFVVRQINRSDQAGMTRLLPDCAVLAGAAVCVAPRAMLERPPRSYRSSPTARRESSASSSNDPADSMSGMAEIRTSARRARASRLIKIAGLAAPRAAQAMVIAWGAVALLLISSCAAPVPRVASVLATVEGQSIAVLEGPPGALRAFFFIDPVCPIANTYVPEILRIIESASGPNLDVVIVHPDRALQDDAVRAHADTYGLPQPIIIDRGHDLVRAIGATVTPEAALIRFDEAPGAFTLLYRGRIDNLYRDFGVRAAAPSRRDLMEAIDAALQGKAIEVPRTTAIGCFIHPGG